MFNRKTNNRENLEQTIDALLTELLTLTPADDAYTTITDRLETIYQLKTIEQAERVNPTAVVTAVANIVGIAIIVKRERTAVVTSKALSLLKLR